MISRPASGSGVATRVRKQATSPASHAPERDVESRWMESCVGNDTAWLCAEFSATRLNAVQSSKATMSNQKPTFSHMSSTALSACIVFRCLRHPGVPRTQDPVFYPVARRCRKGLPSMLRCLGGMFSAFQVTPNDEQGSESSRYCCSRSSARTSEDLSMYPSPATCWRRLCLSRRDLNATRS
jgi:hypothetical protein